MAPEDRLRVIILAAGVGRRLGRDKATLPWGDSTLIHHVVDQFPTERVARCVVVANPQNEAGVRRSLRKGVDMVVNPDPASEMIASVRLGIGRLRAATGPVCVHPVDVFAVSRELVALLHDAWLANRLRIHLPQVAGRGAHPLVVPPHLVVAIEAIPPGRGLDYLLQECAADVVRHTWHDRRLLADLDTPEDYARYRPPVGMADGGRLRDSMPGGRG